MNWQDFKTELEGTELAVHRFMPECPDERITWFETNCRKVPPDWKALLKLFNGAELFIDGVPDITILGIKLEPPLAQLDWPDECCLDYWNNLWQQTGNQGMPIARTSYDSLWILKDASLKEWDLQQSIWLSESTDFRSWQGKVLSDGRNVIESEY